MKYIYALVGIALLVGVAYASYQYGSGSIAQNPKTNIVANNTATNNTVANNTAKNNTVVPSVNTPVLNDGNPNVNVEAKTLAITSPKNGAVVVGDNPFNVTGTVSPNATKIQVVVYEWVYNNTDPDNQFVKAETKVDDYTLTKFKTGDTSWSYAVSHQYGNIHSSEGAKFIATASFVDGTTKQATTQVTYQFATAEMGKPVIYLYPTKTQAVSVNVKPTRGFSYTEPVIGANGWQVTASPDGTLVDNNGNTWTYLFWEGFAASFVTPKEGFVVDRAGVSTFFDEKLLALGLNTKEIADFKEFWVPRMQDKPYYFVTFIPQATFDTYAPLTVSPKPDTVIRVFFDYRELDKPITVPTQVLPKTPERVGFTVTEWGGRLHH